VTSKKLKLGVGGRKTHVKKCSTSLAIKEMQIKAMLRFHLTLVRIAVIKNNSNNKCWQRCGGKRNPHALLVGIYKSVQPLKKTVWKLLKKLKNRPAI
jgi:hypothetical protein